MTPILWLLVGLAHATCDETDPELGSNDCDEDGVTVEQGDCNDGDPETYPDALELCEDRVDNDCDGFYDEECPDEGGSLQGGSVCGTGGSGALLFFPFFGWRRR